MSLGIFTAIKAIKSTMEATATRRLGDEEVEEPVNGVGLRAIAYGGLRRLLGKQLHEKIKEDGQEQGADK